MKLGFIGFGGAGYGLAKGLRQAGLEEVHYHDRMQETPPYAEVIGRHAAEIGAIQAVTFGELLSRVEVVISCVTGAMAVSVADEAAPFLGPGHLYADVNTAAPEGQGGGRVNRRANRRRLRRRRDDGGDPDLSPPGADPGLRERGRTL